MNDPSGYNFAKLSKQKDDGWHVFVDGQGRAVPRLDSGFVQATLVIFDERPMLLSVGGASAL